MEKLAELRVRGPFVVVKGASPAQFEGVNMFLQCCTKAVEPKNMETITAARNTTNRLLLIMRRVVAGQEAEEPEVPPFPPSASSSGTRRGSGGAQPYYASASH